MYAYNCYSMTLYLICILCDMYSYNYYIYHCKSPYIDHALYSIKLVLSLVFLYNVHVCIVFYSSTNKLNN